MKLKIFNLPRHKLRKISEYLIDLSKLLAGSAFVAIFVPSTTGGSFDILSFAGAVFLAVLSLVAGLSILPYPYKNYE